MKKNLSFIAIFCLVFSVVTPALAGGAFNPVWNDQGSGQIRANDVNNWVNVEGMVSTDNPTTGAITKVLVDPANDKIIYVGAVNGGIWKSVNRGATWNFLTDRQSSLSIGAMNFDSTVSDNKTIIAGTGRQSAFSFVSGPLTGIQYTTDGGESWTEKGRTELFGKDITGVAARGPIMMATVRNISASIDEVGLYRSENSGTSFSNAVTGLPKGNIQNLAADPSNSSRFYLSVVNGNDSQSGIYRSDDLGQTWTQVKAVSGLVITSSGKADGRILLSVGSDGVLAAQIQQSNPTSANYLLQILRTANQGKTWVDLGTPATPQFTGLFPTGQTEVHGAVLVDPQNSNVIYAAGDTQYTTNNLDSPNSIGATQYSCPIFRGVYNQVTGKTEWTWITNNHTLSGSAPHADSRTFAIDSSGRLLFGGDGGLNAFSYPATPNTNDWFPIMDNLRTTEMTQSSWNSITHTISAAAQDIGAFFQFPDQKGTYDWSSTSGGDGGPGPVNVKTFGGSGISVVYGSSQYLDGLRRFKVGKDYDAEQSATTLTYIDPQLNNTSILGEKAGYMSFLSIVALNRKDPRNMSIGGKQVFVGTDDLTVDTANKRSFKVTSILTAPGSDISSLAYGTNSNPGTVNIHINALLAGTEESKLYYTADALQTATDKAQMALTSYAGQYVWKAIFDERDGNRFYVTDGTDVWRSTNAGGAFATITNDLPANLVNRRGLAFAANNGVNALFVGGVSNTAQSSSVYVTRYTDILSDDSATPNWLPFGGNLANASIYGLSYDSTDDVLLANLLGRGAWVVYDLTTYFPEATTLVFGNANNDSAPAFILTDRIPVGGITTFARGLTKNGTGTLTINNKSTYTGNTTIANGTLRVNNAGALGTGAVINNATLDIGATSLELGSTYAQSSGSLNLIARSSLSYGNISSGAVTLTGTNTVNVTVGSYIPNNTLLTIINTGGAGVAGIGVPTAINATNSCVGFSAAVSGNNLVLTTYRSGSNSFSGVASNPNGAAVGAVFDNITSPSSDMITVLDALSASSTSQVASSENSMYPTADRGVVETTNGSLDKFVGATVLRLQDSKVEEGNDKSASSDNASFSNDIWAQTYGDYANQYSRGSSNGYLARLWGTVIGIDRSFLSNSVRLGFAQGFAGSRILSADNSGSTRTTSYQSCLYSEYEGRNHPYVLDAVFSYGHNDYNGSRNVTAAAINRTASANYHGDQFSSYFEGGYKFKNKTFDIIPLLAIDYTHLDLSGMTETGADSLNLSVNAQNYNTLQLGTGCRISRAFDTKNMLFTPELHFRYFYAVVNDNQQTLASFAGGGTSFQTNGYRPAPSSFNLGARFEFFNKKNITLLADCDTAFKDSFYEAGGSVTVKYSF